MFNNMFNAMRKSVGRGQTSNPFARPAAGQFGGPKPPYMMPTGGAPLPEGEPTAQMMPAQEQSGLFQQLMQRLGRGNTGFSGGLYRPRSF